MYFKGSFDLRFGDNADWSIENYNNGLNFWKPAGTYTGDYKLFLSENGNVGIGTGSPVSKLDVRGDIRARDGFILEGWANNGYWNAAYFNNTGSNGCAMLYP